MAKRSRGKSSQDRYKEGLRERKSLEAKEAQLKKIQCTTLYRTNTKLIIPKTGLCIHKRSLWKDGKYLGIIDRFVCDETMVNHIDIPAGQMGYQLPVSEYEIMYMPREELERMRRDHA